MSGAQPTATSLAAAPARPVGHTIAVLPTWLRNSRRRMGLIPLTENHLRKSLIRSSSESYAPDCIRAGWPMSALGQKRTFCIAWSMSALSPIDGEIGRRLTDAPQAPAVEGHRDRERFARHVT